MLRRKEKTSQDPYQTVHDSLQDDQPSVPEILKLGAADPLHADGQLGAPLEGAHAQPGEEQKGDKEGDAGHEEVCGFDVGLEGDALDARHADDLGLGGGGVVVVGPPEQPNGGGVRGIQGQESVHSRATHRVGEGHGTGVERPLRDLDRHLRQAGEQVGRRAAGGLDVPVEDVLHEADLDDAHGPVEILGPGRHDGRQLDGRHADHGLRLEIHKQRDGVGGHVGGRVGVAQA